MPIRYTISEDDYVQAARLYMRTRPRSRVWRLFVRAAWVIIVLVVAVILLANAWSSRPLSDVLISLLPLVLMLLFVLFCKLLLPFQWRRLYRRNALLQDQHSLELTDSGLRFVTSAGEGSTLRRVYTRFAENAHAFVLVQQGGQLYHPLPKKDLTPMEVTQMRDLFTAYVRGT